VSALISASQKLTHQGPKPDWVAGITLIGSHVAALLELAEREPSTPMILATLGVLGGALASTAAFSRSGRHP
jgi:hypothetical protein